jgi:hypothetical protein
MGLDQNEMNRYLQRLFGQYEDSFQDAWVEILESNAQTTNEIPPIARRVRNKAINQYLKRKYGEESLQKPLGNNGDGSLTLESVLESHVANEHNDERDDGNDGLYKKMVEFLIGECLRQRNENSELKRKEIELKARRLGLREEWLKFKKDRFESWRKLMEEKGKEKEYRANLHVQLQRERIELRREQLLLKEKRQMSGRALSAPAT